MNPEQIQPCDLSARHRAPLWVRWFLVAAVVGVLVLVIVMVAAGSDHGPSRHQVDESVRTTTPVRLVEPERQRE